MEAQLHIEESAEAEEEAEEGVAVAPAEETEE